MSKAVPDMVSPALAKSGDCSKQRTWYQWVKGSVGAVESHTVILYGERTYKMAHPKAWFFLHLDLLT